MRDHANKRTSNLDEEQIKHSNILVLCFNLCFNFCMTQIILQLPLKPLSVNRKNAPFRGKMCKTKEAREFELEVSNHLSLRRSDFIAFRESHNKLLHSLTFDMIVYVPKKDFFTKKGTISETCLDCSNSIKMVEDAIKEELGIDDSQNCRVSVEKRPYQGERYVTLITISQAPFPRVCPLDNITWEALEALHPLL
jgi:Holliday junction resolvase RusA-like endonuclease